MKQNPHTTSVKEGHALEDYCKRFNSKENTTINVDDGEITLVKELHEMEEIGIQEVENDISEDDSGGTVEDVGPVTPKPLYGEDKSESMVCDKNMVCDYLISDDEDERITFDTSDEENSDVATEELHVNKKDVSQGQGQQSLEDRFRSYDHDEDWDDDLNWEPKTGFRVRQRWFCTNCTRLNLDDSPNCRLCGEHQKSGILNSGFLAPAEVAYEIAEEDGVTPVLPAVVSPLSPLPLSSSAPLDRLTAIGYDERMLLHSEIQMKSHPHPERPDRLRSIMSGLAAAGLLGHCFTIFPREATRAELQIVHTREHVDAVEATSGRKLSYFTSDTYANKNSALAARLAAGISADLASAIMKGRAQNGIALVRPPGHHAEDLNVMGFCLHNNVAVAAKAALASGARKVLILDWDVHHGNGTQEIFKSDPFVLYISIHRHERGLFYPGTGAASEVGSGKGEGFSVNIPWECAGIGDEDYIFAFQHIVLPIARQYAPDMTIISAGFDAAKGDPLGGCKVSPLGYAYMAHMLSFLAQGRMLVVLEGGYNLRSISASVAAVVKVLLGEYPVYLPDNVQPTEAGLATVMEVLQFQAQYWQGLRIPSKG